MNYKGLKRGMVLFGRFRIHEWIGFGSAGAVFSCEDTIAAGKIVAIKVLSRDQSKDEAVGARFRKEWEACQKVAHTNVIVAEDFFDDRAFLAFTMEYMPRGTLADLIESEGPFEIERALKILRQLTAGLSAIHAADLIHRDLKPENILMGSGDLVKISDFGVSVPSSSARDIWHEEIVGTMAYVSPEYIEHGRLDSRSDIYALGVIGFEMIAGKPPFSGESPLATITSKVRADAPTISSYGINCPEVLEAIIAKALARNPSDRYQDIKDFESELKDFAEAFIRGETSQLADTTTTSTSLRDIIRKNTALNALLGMKECKAR